MSLDDAFSDSVAALSDGPRRTGLVELMEWIVGQAPEEEEAVLQAIQAFAKTHNIRVET